MDGVQDISDADVRAEGLAWKHKHALDTPEGNRITWARVYFKDLWNSIHGPDAWALNPWVWVVTFKRET